MTTADTLGSDSVDPGASSRSASFEPMLPREGSQSHRIASRDDQPMPPAQGASRISLPVVP
jgi:hypothetical protein